MQLSEHGNQVRNRLSGHYGISPDAVQVMMEAVSSGGGYQAQFSHPELGGMGQWQQGGMIMVGDMFNNNLKALVSNLCNDIAAAYSEKGLFKPHPMGGMSGDGGQWWPSDLGTPSSVGMQNNQGYAVFPNSARLAILQNGTVQIYDTGAHRIGGVGQQQSQDGSVSFTSQLGPVPLSQLTRIPHQDDEKPEEAGVEPTPKPEPEVPARSEEATIAAPPLSAGTAPLAPMGPASSPSTKPPIAAGDIFDILSKLGTLRDQGVLTEEEFQAKKTELLSRI